MLNTTMPRKTKKEALQAHQDLAAPFLFDDEHLPHKQQWVEAIKERRYEHTGARLLDDDKKVLRLVDLLLRTPALGLRPIAKAMGCSRDTVRAARDLLVEQGKMRPYVERVVAIYNEIVEFGAASLLEDLYNGCLSPGQKPLAIGVISDKRALALGEPTSIGVSGRADLAPDTLSVKSLNDFLLRLPPADGVSSVKHDISIVSCVSSTVDATFDAVNGAHGEAGGPKVDGDRAGAAEAKVAEPDVGGRGGALLGVGVDDSMRS